MTRVKWSPKEVTPPQPHAAPCLSAILLCACFMLSVANEKGHFHNLISHACCSSPSSVAAHCHSPGSLACAPSLRATSSQVHRCLAQHRHRCRSLPAPRRHGGSAGRLVHVSSHWLLTSPCTRPASPGARRLAAKKRLPVGRSPCWCGPS